MIRCIKPDGTFLQVNSEEFNEQKLLISELANKAIEQCK